LDDLFAEVENVSAGNFVNCKENTMIKYIALAALLCFSSGKAFASFIYANEFDVGTNTARLTDNATLSWLNGTNKSSPVSVHSSATFYNQHFGGAADSATYDTFPGISNEILGGPNSYSYGAIQIDFDAPVQSFGMKVENLSGDSFGVYVFDADGSFVEKLSAYVGLSNLLTRDANRYFDGSFHWDFGYDVGRVKLGSEASAGYIYALDVASVPEPSSFILLAIGLLSVVRVRRTMNSSVKKEFA
jgi:hypothetical protein